jgi:RHS repeat-associated protein
MNQWHARTIDLSAWAGKTVCCVFALEESTSGPGPWEMLFANVSLSRQDGSVLPLLPPTASGTVGWSFFSSGGVTNATAVMDQSQPSQDELNPLTTTHYYASDHLGSARMEFAGGGWPVWAEDYAPYGQEIAPQATTNNFKFTSYERDQETGLDYAQARHYTSAFGRFMSPDPSGLSLADPTNPQSFNLYSYVMNNPLNNIDPTGMTCQTNSTDGAVYDDMDGKGCDQVDLANATDLANGVYSDTVNANMDLMNEAWGTMGGGGGYIGYLSGSDYTLLGISPRNSVAPLAIGAAFSMKQWTPDSEYCQSLSNRIDTLVRLIEAKNKALAANNGGLQQSTPVPNMRGNITTHQATVQKLTQSLADAANDYHNKCGDGNPVSNEPLTNFSRTPQFDKKVLDNAVRTILKGALIIGGVVVAVENELVGN